MQSKISNCTTLCCMRFRERASELESSWTELRDATDSKTRGLTEAIEEQQYNRTIEDFEIWLAEVEAQLLSEDYGKDLTSVQNLQKKHDQLESDIQAHQDKMNSINDQADQFVSNEHFNAAPIDEKRNAVAERYNDLQEPLKARDEKLKDALILQQYLRSVRMYLIQTKVCPV